MMRWAGMEWAHAPKKTVGSFKSLYFSSFSFSFFRFSRESSAQKQEDEPTEFQRKLRATGSRQATNPQYFKTGAWWYLLALPVPIL